MKKYFKKSLNLFNFLLKNYFLFLHTMPIDFDPRFSRSQSTPPILDSSRSTFNQFNPSLGESRSWPGLDSFSTALPPTPPNRNIQRYGSPAPNRRVLANAAPPPPPSAQPPYFSGDVYRLQKEAERRLSFSEAQKNRQQQLLRRLDQQQFPARFATKQNNFKKGKVDEALVRLVIDIAPDCEFLATRFNQISLADLQATTYACLNKCDRLPGDYPFGAIKTLMTVCEIMASPPNAEAKLICQTMVNWIFTHFSDTQTSDGNKFTTPEKKLFLEYTFESVSRADLFKFYFFKEIANNDFFSKLRALEKKGGPDDFYWVKKIKENIELGLKNIFIPNNEKNSEDLFFAAPIYQLKLKKFSVYDCSEYKEEFKRIYDILQYQLDNFIYL